MLDLETLAHDTKQSTRGNRSIPAPLRLIFKAFVLLWSVAVPLLLFFWLVPDGNDYASSTIEKHLRLEEQPNQRKLVFVGGSNLAYGIDSGRVERALGRRIVNMGISSQIGLRFMLEEVKSELRSGDAVALSAEYDVYYSPPNGNGSQVLMLIKARPSSAAFLTHWGQWVSVVEGIPIATQKKAFRLFRETVAGLFQRKAGAGLLIGTIERREGFNSYGDLISHLGVRWPYGITDGMDLHNRTVSTENIAIVKAFVEEMRLLSVNVYLLHPPVPRSYYDTQKESIANFHDLLAREVGAVLSPPDAYVLPDSMFFNSIYHLTGSGRAAHSDQVITGLKPYFVSSVH